MSFNRNSGNFLSGKSKEGGVRERERWLGGSAGSRIEGKVRFGRDIETKRHS
jgi:hypothetical protein